MAKEFPDLNKDGKITQADILKGRGVYQEGGSIDDQMMMAMGETEMMPDEEMEDQLESNRAMDPSVADQQNPGKDTKQQMGGLLWGKVRQRFKEAGADGFKMNGVG